MSFLPDGTVFLSSSNNAAVNLAVEESLLQYIEQDREILFLYENEPTVVIGRFQNPWKECRTGLARRKGIPLRRRISGGGTVVHGFGNLNFSVIAGRKVPDKKANLDRIIRALSTLEISIERNERLDLVLRDNSGLFKKVSGSAFRQTSNASMHHGTLLVNADLDALRALLHQRTRNMKARGVESKPSPVANINSAAPALQFEHVIDVLAAEWGAAEGPAALDPDSFYRFYGYISAKERLESPEWIWTRTPEFLEWFPELNHGSPDDAFVVKDGVVAAAPEMAAFLLGTPYNGPDILKAGGDSPPEWLSDLAAWIDGDG